MTTTLRRSATAVLLSASLMGVGAAPAFADHKTRGVAQVNEAAVTQACVQAFAEDSKQNCDQFADVVQSNVNKQYANYKRKNAKKGKHHGRGSKSAPVFQVNQATIVQLCLQFFTSDSKQDCNQTAIVVQDNTNINKA